MCVCVGGGAVQSFARNWSLHGSAKRGRYTMHDVFFICMVQLYIPRFSV